MKKVVIFGAAGHTGKYLTRKMPQERDIRRITGISLGKLTIKDRDVRKEEPTGTYRVKIDPGAKHTGIAVVRNEDSTVVFYEQIEHRAEQIVADTQ